MQSAWRTLFGPLKRSGWRWANTGLTIGLPDDLAKDQDTWPPINRSIGSIMSRERSVYRYRSRNIVPLKISGRVIESIRTNVRRNNVGGLNQRRRSICSPSERSTDSLESISLQLKNNIFFFIRRKWLELNKLPSGLLLEPFPIDWYQEASLTINVLRDIHRWKKNVEVT